MQLCSAVYSYCVLHSCPNEKLFPLGKKMIELSVFAVCGGRVDRVV